MEQTIHRFRSVATALAVAALGAALAWLLLGRPATGIDDADIFFAYARNLAEGHGMVYNVGGERVEGFTSLLWTLVCAGFFRLFDAVEKPLFLLNVLLGTATLTACLRRTDRPGRFLLLLAAVPGWFAWCQATLMETGLWCLLATLSVLAAAEQRGRRLALLLPLLALARPESMLWGGWLLLLLAWRSGLRTALLPAATFGAALLALLLFRLGYFGYPLPNTYYAKVSPDLPTNLWNGGAYLAGYLFLNPAVLFAAIAHAGLLVQWRRRDALSVSIALGLLPGLFIPVLVGGDHFGAFRFYQPVWPLLALLAIRAWRPARPLPPPIQWAALATLCLAGWLPFPSTARMAHEFRIAREGRSTGEAFATMFQDLEQWPTVSTITAGGIKYAYPGTVLDLMGLNSTEMAHAPGPRTGYKNHTAFNNALFYAWKPDILLCGDSAEFDALVLKGLHEEPRFRLAYSKCTLHRNGRAVTAWYANDFLMRLPDEVAVR